MRDKLSKSERRDAVFLVVFTVVAFFTIFYGRTLHVRWQPEVSEIEERLVKTPLLDRYYDFVVSAEAIPNQSRKGRRREDPWEWRVHRDNEVSSGHFTFFVSGWRRLSHSRRQQENFVVYFEKKSGESIEIVRIETHCWPLNDDFGMPPKAIKEVLNPSGRPVTYGRPKPRWDTTEERKPNQALQTTPMTRSGSEKTIEFGRPQRGV